MKRVAIAIVLFMGVVGVSTAQDAEKALKELQGNYSVKSLSKGGMPAPDEIIKEVKGFSIKGDKITIHVADKEEVAKIKLDATKKPAQIDIIPETGPDKDKKHQGIYKLEKGELTIVLTEEGDRPKDFSGDGKDVMKLVLTKKEEKK